MLREVESEGGGWPSESMLWNSVADGIKQLTEYNDRLFDVVVELQKVVGPLFSFEHMTGFREHWTEFIFNCERFCYLSPFSHS